MTEREFCLHTLAVRFSVRVLKVLTQGSRISGDVTLVSRWRVGDGESPEPYGEPYSFPSPWSSRPRRGSTVLSFSRKPPLGNIPDLRNKALPSLAWDKKLKYAVIGRYGRATTKKCCLYLPAHCGWTSMLAGFHRAAQARPASGLLEAS